MNGTATETLSVEELAARVGMTVRTVRFYASRGLIPAARREGRNGYYGQGHIARLELVRELQAHGFTLSAIEGYFERMPTNASPEDVAMHRTLLAPWMPDLPETINREELEVRSGRKLSDKDIELLVAIGVVEPLPTDAVFKVASAHLAVGIQLLDLGLPKDAALAAQRIFTEHGRTIANELTEIFRTMVWPTLRDSDEPPEVIQSLIESFKPLTIQALVTSYQTAVDETKRETVRRRS